MDNTANYIRNRLSLRNPQTESLEILSKLTDLLTLDKSPDLVSEFEKVKEIYPTCTDFERDFPSVCFALATGVGKTRLMGAFIAYLFLEKDIRNFFVMAPNLTIYNKLIDDFSNPNSSKYVFPSIGEFAQRPPKVVTGENYEYEGHQDFLSELTINVFNISKINTETRGGKAPRMKRMAEYLGESYFNYLSNLDDLVLLMDESHHYRADRGMQVINELKPIIGLELTATPQVERNTRTIKFKNVVYEYSLAKAIRDGFVKTPAVATRRDFNPSGVSNEEIDRIKLEDGIKIHEDTKVALDIYAAENNVTTTKPFVLVVAKDTEHAAQLKQIIVSESFFEGKYADKVMEIHSGQHGSEKDENIEKLLSLEKPSNSIEIVIHVNMLKEGWDVTNLYTIIPLRTAASMTLREQTIGRGLRLPYENTTGNSKVDKLTIVSHDRFQEIVDAANQPDSIVRLENIIEITDELIQQKESITSTTNIEQKLIDEEARVDAIVNKEERQQARISLDTRRQLFSTLHSFNTEVRSVSELSKQEVKEKALIRLKENIQREPQQFLFVDLMVEEAETHYENLVEELITNIIEIPRIIIQQSEEVSSGFRDFNLDTAELHLSPVSEEILRKNLADNQEDTIIGEGRIIPERLDTIIVDELVKYPEVDYDEQSDQLFKLAGQAINKLKTYLEEEEWINVVQYHKRDIASFIYNQMMKQFYCDAPDYEKPVVRPFSKIEPHNFSKYIADNVHDYSDTITPTHAIPSKVFTGFKKACHGFYKFDSKTEKDFASILEHENDVLKWLRPAKRQFRIYWNNNSRQYVPDFVAETKEAIYMIETKQERDIENEEVLEKAAAALEFCKYATEYMISNGGKPWKYIIIPHNEVLVNMRFNSLVKRFEHND